MVVVVFIFFGELKKGLKTFEIPGLTQEIRQPNFLIVEGINVFQNPINQRLFMRVNRNIDITTIFYRGILLSCCCKSTTSRLLQLLLQRTFPQSKVEANDWLWICQQQLNQIPR